MSTQEQRLSPEPGFFNQFDSFDSKTLANNACGPSVVAMAINQLFSDHSISRRVTPFQILWQAGQSSILPGDISQFKVSIIGPDGNPGLIPIGHRITDKLKQNIQQDKASGIRITLVGSISDTKDYIPTFTLNGGWDHRGSEAFFTKFGLTARQFGEKHDEKFSLNLLTSLVLNGHLVMASTHHSEDSSHLVLIHGFRENNGGELLISDPREVESKWISANYWWENQFRGYGTVIYNNPINQE